jgi:hypothetical protein
MLAAMSAGGPSPRGVELFLGRLPPGVAERIFGFGFHLWMAKPKYFMGSDDERNPPFTVSGDVDAFLRQRAYDIDHVLCTLDRDVCCLEATAVGPNRAQVRTLTWQSAPLLGLRDIATNARFPITGADGVECWPYWGPEGFWAYQKRFWPQGPLPHGRLLNSPPPALADGRRRPVEVHLRDPQGFLRRDAPLLIPAHVALRAVAEALVHSDDDASSEHTSEWDTDGDDD